MWSNGMKGSSILTNSQPELKLRAIDNKQGRGQMKKPRNARHRAASKSLHERISKELGRPLARKFGSLFARYEIRGGDGRGYRVGSVIRSAWTEERSLSDRVVSDAGGLVKRIVQ